MIKLLIGWSNRLANTFFFLLESEGLGFVGFNSCCCPVTGSASYDIPSSLAFAIHSASRNKVSKAIILLACHLLLG